MRTIKSIDDIRKVKKMVDYKVRKKSPAKLMLTLGVPKTWDELKIRGDKIRKDPNLETSEKNRLIAKLIRDFKIQNETDNETKKEDGENEE